MQPLHSLISSAKPKTQTLTWNDSALASFTATKDALANASLLSYPQSDAPTCLMTDASDTAVGAVLQQNINGKRNPISFFSQEDDTSRNPLQYLWQRITRCLPLHQKVSPFCLFHVLTDHKPLTYALNAFVPINIRHDKHDTSILLLSSPRQSDTSVVRTMWLLTLCLELKQMPSFVVNHPLLITLLSLSLRLFIRKYEPSNHLHS